MPRSLKFSVRLKVAFNPDTGEQFILPTDKELAELRRLSLDDMEQAIAATPKEEGEDAAKTQDKAAKRFRAETLALIEAQQARLKVNRAEAEGIAVEQDYDLAIPTADEHAQALAKAKPYNDETGDQRPFEEALYVMEILPACVIGLTPKEVRALPPVIFNDLARRLVRAIQPSENRLAFTAPLPKTS